MIRVHELTKSFGRSRVLTGVTFTVAPGEAVAMWGPNGAGKSTALRCVLGLLRYHGDIAINNMDIRTSGRAARRLIGYVPQELSFYDDLRVREAMRLFTKIRRVPTSRIAQRLADVGLTGHERKHIGDLSGGMKQKLAIAIALLADPPVLLLDEPTSNLDAASRREVLDSLIALRNNGKTILFTSHRSEEMERLANRVLTIENGVIVDRRVVEQSKKCDSTPDELGSTRLQSAPDHSRPLRDARTVPTPSTNGVTP